MKVIFTWNTYIYECVDVWLIHTHFVTDRQPLSNIWKTRPNHIESKTRAVQSNIGSIINDPQIRLFSVEEERLQKAEASCFKLQSWSMY